MLIAFCQVSRFGGVVVEAAEGSGLLVGAPYAGLGLANFGKVPTTVLLHCIPLGLLFLIQFAQVYFFNSSTELPGGDISSQCEGTSAPCPGRWVESNTLSRQVGPTWTTLLLWQVSSTLWAFTWLKLFAPCPCSSKSTFTRTKLRPHENVGISANNWVAITFWKERWWLSCKKQWNSNTDTD